jgi:hypothetical protein
MLSTLPPEGKLEEEMDRGRWKRVNGSSTARNAVFPGLGGSASIVGGRNTFSSCVSVLVRARLTLTRVTVY